MAFPRGGLRRFRPQTAEGPSFAELFGALPVAVLVLDFLLTKALIVLLY